VRTKSTGNLLDEIEAGALDSTVGLPDLLRKCVALGGVTGSSRLRDWATLELKGYGPNDELPRYRKTRGMIFGDGMANGVRFKGQQIPLLVIPEVARPVLQGDVPLAYSLAELVELLGDERDDHGGVLRLAPPGVEQLLALMNNTLARNDRTSQWSSLRLPPSQVLERIYWMVSKTVISGILDVVRTTLVELVAEMRAGTPAGVVVPSAEVTEQAVSVAIYGNRNRVVVAQAAPGAAVAATTAGASATGSAEPETKGRRWMFWAAGAATIIGTLFTALAATGSI
jgi:hypothetical protein